MIGLNELAFVFVATVVTVAGTWECAKYLAKRKEQRQEQKLQADSELAALTNLAGSVAKLHGSLSRLEILLAPLSNIPALLEGMTAMCKLQADMLDQFKASAELFQGTLTGSPRDYEYAEETPLAQRQAEEREITEILRREKGLGREEAAARIKERDLYSQMARGGR